MPTTWIYLLILFLSLSWCTPDLHQSLQTHKKTTTTVVPRAYTERCNVHQNNILRQTLDLLGVWARLARLSVRQNRFPGKIRQHFRENNAELRRYLERRYHAIYLATREGGLLRLECGTEEDRQCNYHRHGDLQIVETVAYVDENEDSIIIVSQHRRGPENQSNRSARCVSARDSSIYLSSNLIRILYQTGFRCSSM